ncbi:4-coumarate--CoA ligase 1-like [Drosophila innubila]|uniref:4-coumarate--CoA ligase 1-like n=1 Tax=Drosophila innubila TaxID=198719 RepID=UPI00148C9E7F|nr:4-coumarate--CoA ligase 1-like [Drosophila innubila]
MNVTWDSTEKIWSGPPRTSMYNKDTSLGIIVFNTMRNYPKNVIQISDTDGIVVTNEMAITWAVRIAQQLKKRGLDHQSVVGIVAKNSTYVMPVGVACLLNTTPFHAVSPIFDEATLKYMFEITKPAMIFCDGEVYDTVREATKDWSPEIIIISHPIDGLPSIENMLAQTNDLPVMLYEPEPLKNGSDQTVAILCSSGTTGLPKAVCISNSVLIEDNLLVNGETIFFVNSGIDWISGLWAFMFCILFGSTRIISENPFSAEYFVQLVKKYKITYATLAPIQLAAICACKDATPFALSSMRNLNYGGGILSQAILLRIQELFKNITYTSGYGMTEAGMITMKIGVQNAATAGQPIPGVRLRIVDESGNSLGHNEVGEIYVHNGKAWNGYYGNPNATRQIRDSDGWIHTGDLGYIDNDNNLNIIDRKKETLKYQGIHYWPTEIENAILELPQVKAVCVVGVPDELIGDIAGALVLKHQDCEISAKEIIDHVAKRLSLFAKHLHAGVRFTDKLPFNSNGKYVRKTALEMFKALNCQE